jgi:protein tyrosine phosphatase type 4A
MSQRDRELSRDSLSNRESLTSSLKDSLVNKPSFIQYNSFRFLIMDSPKDSNIYSYLQILGKYNVKVLVRISDPTYSTEEVERAGIAVEVRLKYPHSRKHPTNSRLPPLLFVLSSIFVHTQELQYPDGQAPSVEVVERWLDLCRTYLAADKGPSPCLAVHCVTGLGRAPVLVALALICYGMEASAALALIRDRRRGSINAAQEEFLQEYEGSLPQRKTEAPNSCAVM